MSEAIPRMHGFGDPGNRFAMLRSSLGFEGAVAFSITYDGGMSKYALLPLLLAGSVAFVGCANDSDTTETTMSEASAGGSEVAMTNCVVCGPSHQIAVADASGSAEYEGETYYFCSDYCEEAFGEEPTKYVSAEAPTE